MGKMFEIGDRVKKTQSCFYSLDGDKSGVPIGNTGTIIDSIHRYKNTSASYYLYIVQFDGKSLTNELENRYTESSLELIVKK